MIDIDTSRDFIQLSKITIVKQIARHNHNSLELAPINVPVMIAEEYNRTLSEVKKESFIKNALSVFSLEKKIGIHKKATSYFSNCLCPDCMSPKSFSNIILKRMKKELYEKKHNEIERYEALVIKIQNESELEKKNCRIDHEKIICAIENKYNQLNEFYKTTNHTDIDL